MLDPKSKPLKTLIERRDSLFILPEKSVLSSAKMSNLDKPLSRIRKFSKSDGLSDEVPYEAHVMVDVETMGRVPGCAVLSIGAVRFDPDQYDVEEYSKERSKDLSKEVDKKLIHLLGKNQFYTVINSSDSSARGFSCDPETMKWWKRQAFWPELSRQIADSDVSVAQACTAFSDFLKSSHSGGGVKLWANSPGFDISILRAMFKVVDKEFPVDYRQEMDYRTIMELAYPRREKRPSRPKELGSLPLHHALGDAASQAHQLIIAKKYIKAIKSDIDDLDKFHQKDRLKQALNGIDEHSVNKSKPAHGGRHMMLEVKTLGKSKGSAIISIGAVIFDPTARQAIDSDPDHRFYVVLSSFDMGNYGFGSDPETVKWWKSQPIWSELSKQTSHCGVPLELALKQLTNFIEKNLPDKVWANSPTFDIDMLREAFAAANVDFPVSYRQEMDYRTVMDLVYTGREKRPVVRQEKMMEHHALGDAISQAQALVIGMKKLALDADGIASPNQDIQAAQQVAQQAADNETIKRRRGAFRLG